MLFNSVGSGLVVLINTYLSLGTVPAAFKHAVVRPLLKKPSLDSLVLSNFRPICPFSLKFYKHLFLYSYSPFWKTTLLVRNFSLGLGLVIAPSLRCRRCTMILRCLFGAKCLVALVLLDVAGAFDTADHTVLLSCLKHYVGVRGTALTVSGLCHTCPIEPSL